MPDLIIESTGLRKDPAMSRIVSNPETYFRELVPARRDLLRRLEAEAKKEKIPIVGPVVGQLLYILARALGARRILELGTATGYSAIFLGDACRESGGTVITLEADPALAARARENAAAAGLNGIIDVRVGDALEMVARIEPPFHLIFMDIEKKDYERALPDCERLMPNGGLLVADNVAFPDADAFNQAVQRGSAWRSVSLLSFLPEHSPEKDGICLALRV
jgi:predicted O-methyltransferase YrrM